MFLDDLGKPDQNSKLSRLAKTLSSDFGVDISMYEDFDSSVLKSYIDDLENDKSKIMLESSFNTYHTDPAYARVMLLSEALRMILKEIHPKRSHKKVNKVDETLDYKVHTSTGVAVDHNIDEDTPRPDLYWRKDQWEDEQRGDNYPVEAIDAPETGEAYSIKWKDNNPVPEQENQETETMNSYAPNAQPVGGTHENEQQAGVYVAVMNPNRFLGDEDVNIMSIEPNDKSQNEVSPLSRKVSRIMVDADEETNEGVEDMTTKADIIKGLSGLLESTLLNENELQRAEIVFATNDLVMRLGKMIEDLSKMGTDDIMPLVDGLRDNYGPDVAESFSRDAEVKIQEAANGIDSMKQIIDSYREKFEGRISDEDVQQPIDLSTLHSGGSEEPVAGDLGGELGDPGAEDAGLGDLGAEDSGLGELGDDEETKGGDPLGRSLKESKVVNIKGKKVKLTLEQIEVLHKAKILTEKLNMLNTAAIIEVPCTAILNIKGKSIRITETQLKSLLFAKKFKQRVDEKKANNVKLSESQAKMLVEAKMLTQKIGSLLEG